MGRTKRYYERMVAAFPKGTFADIDKFLGKGEDRTEFIREAVTLELFRRMGKARWETTASSPLAQRSGQE